MTFLPEEPLNEIEEKAEYWDLFDKQGNFVRKMRRGDGFVPPELHHKTIEVIATDFAGHILVTQRSLEKRRDGGFWEFPAGSVMSGEEPIQAALRELEEETGLRPIKLKIFHKVLVPGMMRLAYFAYIPNLVTASVRLQKGETMNYRIVTVPQWEEMLAAGLFAYSRMRNYSERFYRAVEENVGMIQELPKEVPEKKQTFRKVQFGEE